MVGKYSTVPGGTVYMCIDFRRRHTLMSEHFLNKPQIRPILDQMGGKRMPESMGRNRLGHSGKNSRRLDCLESGDAA